jgi:hypothetical protein
MQPTRLVSWSLLLATLGCGAGPSLSTRVDVEIPWADLWPGLARPEAVVAVDDAAFPVRRPDALALEALRKSEAAWRARDAEGFDAARRAIGDDPVAAFWLARMLIRDTLFLRRQVGEDAAALVGEPAWRRPFDALTAMGDAAVPCVVLDLLRQRSADLRDLGAELLHEMGPSVLPSWERVAQVPDPAVRRYVVQALRGFSDPRSDALLDRARTDADFGVRAEAYRSLAAQNEDMGPLLRAAIEAEEDRFVRRAIVEGLGDQGGAENAAAILAFLELAIADRDRDGVEAANLALMAMTGRPEYDSVPGWRQYLRTSDLPRRNEGGR